VLLLEKVVVGEVQVLRVLGVAGPVLAVTAILMGEQAVFMVEEEVQAVNKDLMLEVMAQMVQCVSFGPEQLAHSHQLARAIFN
jgi:hypothetical protein